ncbi:hypothetical protein Taro_055348 [Colocasia esculenta]|uniref:Aminotransferase-like plant mobile domain-containing protein n=1 Tax=Colocasia esculenta TaxID=4460 RepID=A0A843XQR9_COLES|nr:hypothetical protein [Colocasia esculenta]
MEGRKDTGEGSFWRKRQAERRGSRLRAEATPVEEEVADVEMEAEAPVMNMEEERKKRAKTMKSESLGLFDVGKGAGESEDEHLDRLVRVSRRDLVSDPGAQADLDLRRFLVLFLGESEDEHLDRLVRVSRRDLVSDLGAQADLDLRRFLVLFLGRLLFSTRGDAVHCHFLPMLEDLSEVGGYAWGATFLAHQFNSLGASERQTSTSGFFPFLQVVWQPYLGEGDEGQPWLVQARPYFGRSVWLHALNLVLPLHLYLSQCSLGLRQSAVEFPVRDWFCRPGRSFRGLHDTTDWCERAKEQIDNWERRGKVDVAGEGRELERAQLVGAVLRAEEAQRHLEERERDLWLTTEHAMDLQGQRDQLQGEVQTTRSERDQLRIRAEAAEAQVAEATKELEALRVQRSPVEWEELERVPTELRAQEAVSRSLQKIVTDIGRSHSRSRSGASASRATGASVGQYLAGSSNRRRNEEEERRRQGEASTPSARGGEMLPPLDRQEGSGESGGGQ